MTTYKILFVDDEINILQSLKRAFFNYPEFEILTADSAEEAVATLATERIDVLVSDEKMPKIEGSQLVEYAKNRFPDVIRCILTGYADMEKIIKAVNKGEVYRYLVKPWNNEDLITTVRSAAEFGRLKRYNHELEAQLKAHNAALKKQIAERTAHLEKALNAAKILHNRTEENFEGTVALVTHLMGLLSPDLKENTSRVTRLSERIAHKMQMDKEEISILRTAALLYKLGALAGKGTPPLDSDRQAVAGAELLTRISTLTPIARLIRHYREHFDGSGKPDRLKGEDIPLGSRIMAIAADYVEETCSGSKTPQEAMQSILEGANSLYDPEIVKILQELEKAVGTSNAGTAAKELPIQIKNLTAGMILKNDLISKNGVLVIPCNTPLSQSMVDHLGSTKLLDTEETVYLKGVVRKE